MEGSWKGAGRELGERELVVKEGGISVYCEPGSSRAWQSKLYQSKL